MDLPGGPEDIGKEITSFLVSLDVLKNANQWYLESGYDTYYGILDSNAWHEIYTNRETIVLRYKHPLIRRLSNKELDIFYKKTEDYIKDVIVDRFEDPSKIIYYLDIVINDNKGNNYLNIKITFDIKPKDKYVATGTDLITMLYPDLSTYISKFVQIDKLLEVCSTLDISLVDNNLHVYGETEKDKWSGGWYDLIKLRRSFKESSRQIYQR